MPSHEILGGLMQIYWRGGRVWHCSTSLKGRQYRVSTKETGLEQAKAFAEDWLSIGSECCPLIGVQSSPPAGDQRLTCPALAGVAEGRPSAGGGYLRL